MKTTQTLFLAGALLVGCGGGEQLPEKEKGETHFEESHYYRRTFFAGDTNCERASAAGVNCYQTLDLCANGRALLIVTDIMNDGSYSLRDGQVVLTLEGPREAGLPETSTFAREEADAGLVGLGDERWERYTPPYLSCG
ncbi:hypothetical protein [Archangium lipolyticum]|uniref:hypothetical protein n=1 Tax=Archangium lipolyticum TaxID=2970465 RepID=UPI00214A78DC|nr:hypothetical protein [Archangium lipolyticum]